MTADLASGWILCMGSQVSHAWQGTNGGAPIRHRRNSTLMGSLKSGRPKALAPAALRLVDSFTCDLSMDVQSELVHLDSTAWELVERQNRKIGLLLRHLLVVKSFGCSICADSIRYQPPQCLHSGQHTNNSGISSVSISSSGC